MPHKRKSSDKEAAWSALWPGQRSEKSIALLKALHIITRDGELNADSRRKLKQVLHLTNLLRPTIETLLESSDNPNLADMGAGKSYLGFILYDWVLGPAGRGSII